MTKHDSKTADEYYEGKGCNCFARNQDECACDVDWTPKEIIELRKKNAELEKSVSVLHKQIETMLYNQPIRDLEQKADELRGLLDMADTWSMMNTYAITVDDIHERMTDLREQAKQLKGGAK